MFYTNFEIMMKLNNEICFKLLKRKYKITYHQYIFVTYPDTV